MSGLGAWSFGRYKYAANATITDPRKAAGLRAFKAELVYTGHGAGVVVDMPIYGNHIRDRVAELQHAWNILGRWGVYEGEIDQLTARYLFWTRANRAALKYGIPDRLVHKMVSLESLHDPVAQGYLDPKDEGGAQIHMPYHPEISLSEAWDPAYYLPWIAKNLVEAAAYVTGGSGLDFDGGVAAHNVGWDTARLWVADGKPDHGRLINGTDWYMRATMYVAVVKGQRVF